MYKIKHSSKNITPFGGLNFICSLLKNENIDGLVRQYVPKGTDLKNISAKLIKEIQYKINRRPRKILNFEKPVDLFYSLAK